MLQKLQDVVFSKDTEITVIGSDALFKNDRLKTSISTTGVLWLKIDGWWTTNTANLEWTKKKLDTTGIKLEMLKQAHVED